MAFRDGISDDSNALLKTRQDAWKGVPNNDYTKAWLIILILRYIVDIIVGVPYSNFVMEKQSKSIYVLDSKRKKLEYICQFNYSLQGRIEFL